jgi:hypothetical protein
MCLADRGVIGFTAAAAPNLFPCRAKPSSRPSPNTFVFGSSSCPISSSEFLQLRSRSCGLSTPEHYLPKFQPSLRRHRKHPPNRAGFHPALRAALRFSQPLDGSRHFRLCELVSSRCHIQGSSVQGFPSPHSQPDSSPDLCPLVVVRIPSIMTTLAHRPKPAATHAALDFEALLHVKIRSCWVGVNLPEQSIPSSVFTSSRFSLFPPCSRLTQELRS